MGQTATMALSAFFLLIGLIPCHGFNLDTENPTVFQEDGAGFGQTVVQFNKGRLIVGAPLKIAAPNQTGQLYNCEFSTKTCMAIPINVPQEAVNMSLGFTLAAAVNPSQILACGPIVHRTCKENAYINGLCFMLDSNLHQEQNFPTSLQECPKLANDIVFLIDGSGSINRNQFIQMKNFIKTIMDQFTGTKTQFSLMQYSDDFEIHFTFDDFKNDPVPKKLVDPIKQLKGWTHTASGIRKVVRELFQEWNGARKDANKILIVITDGQIQGDSLNYRNVIPEAEKEGIIRYAIGVGFAFRNPSAYQELQTIASNPPQEHVFQVDNFDALKNIQNQLQEKIFAIEGTQTGSNSSFEYEVSQEGFSAVFTSDGPLLGAVGSFDWSGGAFLYDQIDKPTFINTSLVNLGMNDAYLGYSIDVIVQRRTQSLVMGAPRYQHIGMVAMFKKSFNTWEKTDEVIGKQIGSYFGATLCAVDVNNDANTDLILIGAPYYYERNQGGQVSICSLPQRRAKLRCEVILRGQPGHLLSRFGAALAVLGDVNGDKMIDVAVGAPGEEENRGAIYLFHGMAGSSINSSYSQRITGSQFSPTIQYFGQSLSGGHDITQDGLMDVAVGANGQVLLLRAQPILRLEVHMQFTPKEVRRSVFECQEQKKTNQEAGVARICLMTHKLSEDQLGELRSTVTCNLVLDPGRVTSRAIFDETKNRTRGKVLTIGKDRICEEVKLLLPNCVDDPVTPLILNFNFSLVGQPIASAGNLRPVLAANAPKLFTGAFPFEKNCGNDSICQDDLSITVSFLSLQTLVVGSLQDLNGTVTVRNQGEDSYGTVVTFLYPPGLSFRRASGVQNQPKYLSVGLVCVSETAENESIRSSQCSINHPIFREGSMINFNITFDVSPMASLGNKMVFKANVVSENSASVTNKTSLQLELPVKYAIYPVISSHEESTKYLNFSTSEEKSISDLKHKYQVNNLGQRDLAIKIDFWVPIELNKKNILKNVQIIPSQNLSCTSEKKDPSHSNFLEQIRKTSVVNCSIAVCQRFRCDIPFFNVQEEFTFTIEGKLSFSWVKQTESNNLLFTSMAEIIFDESKYVLLPEQMFMTNKIETKVEQYEVHSPVPLIVGSSVGGLVLLALITAGLYKLGFFKRQYKDMMNNPEESAPNTTPPE
ncbi:integrin alpha-M isoform X1 [Sarcophilus harrisii]|uniref:Integrin subunit alpha M n=2 Tax=Sarcophilus harrisii TaxID=9305 RepID=A0A7N4Q0I3_SARHA|nr:integrin alpha-M isoform X1 [Sarcophilus harrisii]